VDSFFVLVIEAVVVSVADSGLRDAVAGTRAGKLKIDARPLSANIYKNFKFHKTYEENLKISEDLRC